MSAQTSMASGTQNTQSNPNAQVVQSFAQGTQGQAVAAGLMESQAQDSTTSQAACTHIAPGSLASFDFWFEGEDPRWRAAERTISVIRDAIHQEAGENDTAEIQDSPEGAQMDLDNAEESQAALAAHIAFVFAAYGVDTNH